MTTSFRIERDSMGELQVPADALWGAQTQRAVQNFPISGLTLPRAFIAALGLVKQAMPFERLPRKGEQPTLRPPGSIPAGEITRLLYTAAGVVFVGQLLWLFVTGVEVDAGTLRDASRDDLEGLRSWLRRAGEEILLIRTLRAAADRRMG